MPDMKWTPDAESAVKNVPFFVRKKVRARVEEEARSRGRDRVALADVKAAQARFLNRMSREIRGYRVEACFGSGGCPNRILDSAALVERIEAMLEQEDLLGFLRSQVGEDLKFHHEFRVALADCPNACSQPQIKDIGIIGACAPELTNEPCSHCEACVDACREDAICLGSDAERPQIDYARCLNCGKCMQVCPTGTIGEGARGFRVQLGGKLGRHPRLARELAGIYSEQAVIEIVRDCIRIFKQRSRHGERFGHILTDADFAELAERHRD
jgi:anaerobic sulfite reductase subunit C